MHSSIKGSFAFFTCIWFYNEIINKKGNYFERCFLTTFSVFSIYFSYRIERGKNTRKQIEETVKEYFQFHGLDG
jgi:hypothetical protein